MTSDKQCVIFFLLLMSGVVSIGGLLVRAGKLKHWFLMPSYPVLMPRAAVYVQVLLGLMIFSIAVSLLMPTPEATRNVWLWIVFPLLVIALVLAAWQPAWIKPKWVRWLEENHGDILELLIEEARKTPDWRDWAKRVGTQEGLEAWVAEVRRKHGL